MIVNRGALIVLEGCDRSGKSTQCIKLVEALRKNDILAENISFPDRTTVTGKLIAEYLTNKTELNDRAIHLLFSANRWELCKKMERMLNDGITLIVDRYAFSGVAYSASKPNMKIAWCKQSDVGLPKPDLVFLLTMSCKALAKRPGFGKEIYEQTETQQRVAKLYKELKDDSWVDIEAEGTVQEVNDILLADVMRTINLVKTKPLGKL